MILVDMYKLKCNTNVSMHGCMSQEMRVGKATKLLKFCAGKFRKST